MLNSIEIEKSPNLEKCKEEHITTPKSIQKPKRISKLQNAPSVSKTYDFSSDASPKRMKKSKARKISPSTEPRLNERIAQIWTETKGISLINKLIAPHTYQKSQFKRLEEEEKVSNEYPVNFAISPSFLNKNTNAFDFEKLTTNTLKLYDVKGMLPNIIGQRFLNEFITQFNSGEFMNHNIYSKECRIDNSKNQNIIDFLKVFFISR